MSSIPVIVMGIRRAKNKAEATRKHLRDIGFKNVKIFYGLDIKKSNPENIKHNQIVTYNNQKIMDNFKGDQLIVAEDDVRITRPEDLFNHLKRGLKGVERLVYAKKLKIRGIVRTIGTQMVGYDRSGINKVLSLPLSTGHLDIALTKHTNEKVPSKSYGIEYVYPDMKLTAKGEAIGLTDTHRKQKQQIKQSRDYDESIVHQRYKN